MDSIYIFRDDQEFGPYTLAEIGDHLASGAVLSFDLARLESESGWRSLDELVQIDSASPEVAEQEEDGNEWQNLTSSSPTTLSALELLCLPDQPVVGKFYPVLTDLSKLVEFGEFLILPPLVSLEKAQESVADEVQTYGSSWPRQLQVPKLTSSMRCIYAPVLVVNGEGSAEWSAAIGTEEKYQKECGLCKGKPSSTLCSRCGGRGTEFAERTVWSSGSGVVRVSVSEAVHAFDEKSVACPVAAGNKIPFDKILRFTVEGDPDVKIAESIPILPPTIETKGGALQVAKDAVKVALYKKAKSSALARGTRYKDLNVVNDSYDHVEYKLVLQPFWVGGYSFKGKQHRIHVNGVTGQARVEVPPTVWLGKWMPPFLVLLASALL